jgi:hypothetical protein
MVSPLVLVGLRPKEFQMSINNILHKHGESDKVSEACAWMSMLSRGNTMPRKLSARQASLVFVKVCALADGVESDWTD